MLNERVMSETEMLITQYSRTSEKLTVHKAAEKHQQNKNVALFDQLTDILLTRQNTRQNVSDSQILNQDKVLSSVFLLKDVLTNM